MGMDWQRHLALDGLRDDPTGPGVLITEVGLAATGDSPSVVTLPGQKGAPVQTHEAFIHAVRGLAAARIQGEAAKASLHAAKLVYGGGQPDVRGTCYYGVWQNGEAKPADFIEVSAIGEESPCQLAGTTLHELGHVLAGHGEGHSAVWKACCESLGLAHAQASSQSYKPEDFAPTLWAGVMALPVPEDGQPNFKLGTTHGLTFKGKPRPCSVGRGRKGGTSRGVGSGSRLRLYECQCVADPEQGVTPKARVGSDSWRAVCSRCEQVFKRVEKPAPVGPPANLIGSVTIPGPHVLAALSALLNRGTPPGEE